MVIPAFDFFNQLRAGTLPGIDTFSFFGRNDAVGTVDETVWTEGGIYVYPAAGGVQMTLSSDDANDAAAGTGARTVLVTYLDSAYVQQTETIILNGTTGVNSVATDILRVQTMVVVTAGSGAENAGIVYLGTGSITAGKPAVVFGCIQAADNLTHHGFYTVPAGKTAYVFDIVESVSSGKVLTGKLLTRANGGLFLVTGEIELFEQASTLPNRIGIQIAAETDVEFRAHVDATTGVVTASIQGFLHG